MNLISKQAGKFLFFYLDSNKSYQSFIQLVEQELLQYSQFSYKVQFVETLMCDVKEKYEEHLLECTSKEDCPHNFFYESVIFFLNDMRVRLCENLSSEDFKEVDVIRYRTGIDEIIAKLNEIQLGQQITYDDFAEQFEEMKSYFFMSKNSWDSKLVEKFVEMVCAGVISETVSKQMVSVIQASYL